MTRLANTPADGGLSIDGKDNHWLDGDVGGESTTLTAKIQLAR
jgi:hypothetical protein